MLNKVNHQNQVKKAIRILEKYYKQSNGDDVIKSYQGWLMWHERECLDYAFKYAKDEMKLKGWKISYTTGHFKSNQNHACIGFHIDDERSVVDLMVDMGFLPREIESIIEQYKDSLGALGVLLEAKMFTPAHIAF